MAEVYSGFANVYDKFMEATPYEQWGAFLHNTIKKYGVSEAKLQKSVKIQSTEAVAEAGNIQCVEAEAEAKFIQNAETEEVVNDQIPEQNMEDALDEERNLILDLGCGTGKMTKLLADYGYDVMGVDMSVDMLLEAKKRMPDTLFLCQDMRELELYCTVGTVVSLCDSINYITEPEELLEVFSLVNNYLYPGGLFIFDFNTRYKYEKVIGNQTIAEAREDCAFIWENFYDKKTCINQYDVTFFVKEEAYERFEETHIQRGYTLKEIKGLLLEAGLECLFFVDADTKKRPTRTSERIFAVARECTKKNRGV